MLRPGGAGGERHLGDHRRAALREDEVVVRIRLALHADKTRLDAEDARLERAARVLPAGGGRERSEVANGRGTNRKIHPPRPWIGERLDRPALDAAGRPRIVRVASCSSPASAPARIRVPWPWRGTSTAETEVAAVTT